MNWKFWKKEEKNEMSLWFYAHRERFDEIINDMLSQMKLLILSLMI